MARGARLGFTLVEILVVVVILGILASVVAAQFTGTTEEAKRGAFIAELKIFADAANLYYAKEGDYLEDSSSGEFPAGFDAYTDRRQWIGGTPIGGVWDCERDSFGVRSAIGVHFLGVEPRDDAYMTLIDRSFDDGDLEGGLFRKFANDRFYYIVEY